MVRLESLLKHKNLLFHCKEPGNAQMERTDNREKIVGGKMHTATVDV